MMEKISDFAWMMSWFLMQCDGDWEHQFGVAIKTTDNPGWSIKISLTDTTFEGLTMSPETHQTSDIDWYRFQIEDRTFVGYCGPNNLLELIRAFRCAVESFISKEGA
jgi:hypothetical protein